MNAIETLRALHERIRIEAFGRNEDDEITCWCCLGQWVPGIPEAHADDCLARPDAIDQAVAEIEALVGAVQSLAQVLETHGPRSCGACGTPMASCDMNCVEAAAVGQIERAARAALAPFREGQP